MNNRSLRLIATIALMTLAGGIAEQAKAMPNFARKLNAPCAMCHTTIPRLNEVGYKFRAAGFRMPDQIGKEDEQKFELGNYFAGRLQARYDASKSKLGSVVSDSKNQFSFAEVTLYPATGSWGKYFSSLFELSLLPEENMEIENAYVRIDAGKEKQFFTGRLGIFHPFEGFGASDRPVAISRPFFQTMAANYNQSTYFTPWGFDQAAVEGGLDLRRTSIRGSILSGLMLSEEEGTIKAFPAQGGNLSRGSKIPGHNNPDFQVFANQILNASGGNVSLHYYHGNLALPIGGDIGNLFRNRFDRLALYAGYPIIQQLHVYGGFQQGRDHLAVGGTFNSRGTFLEADVPVSQYATPGLRYDWFDPATNKAKNEISGVTAFVNIPLQNGFQAIAEYSHRNFKRGLLPERKDNVFQIRFIFIL